MDETGLQSLITKSQFKETYSYAILLNYWMSKIIIISSLPWVTIQEIYTEIVLCNLNAHTIKINVKIHFPELYIIINEEINVEIH